MWDKNAIDSLKVRLPIKDVTIQDQSMLEYWAETNVHSGDIDESTYKLRAKAIEAADGVKTRYLIQPC